MLCPPDGLPYRNRGIDPYIGIDAAFDTPNGPDRVAIEQAGTEERIAVSEHAIEFQTGYCNPSNYFGEANNRDKSSGPCKYGNTYSHHSAR